MQKKLTTLLDEILKNIHDAKTLDDLNKIRIKYFGKKSEFMNLMKSMNDIPSVDRPAFGKMVNDMREKALSKLEEKQHVIEGDLDKNDKMIDVSLTGKPFVTGRMHPLTQTLHLMQDIFVRLGFGIADGPDIEADYYNFTALNFPNDHPARDTQDTFFLNNFDETGKPFLLRTHTSPVQVRFMKEHKPPFQIIMPGSVYRCDSDISHTPMFHQVEGLAVGENISFANLKSVLEAFVHELFGKNTKLRFRPSFFPFTEPSAEIDISCVVCKGKGCRICKDTGWLEILGSGMVHPNVFQFAGYDPEKITGFAFGIGIERVAMLLFGLDDIRRLYENDVRFLRQF